MLSPTTRKKYLDWWNNDNQNPVIVMTSWDGAPPAKIPENPEEIWFDFPSRLARELYTLEHTVYLEDAFPYLFVNFGPGILGACMGGKYAYDRETFWFTEPVLENLEEIHQFRIQENNFWWRIVLDYTDFVLKQARGRYLVSLTDIGGGMDILAGLRGTERLLLDLVNDPTNVRKALEVIYEEWWNMFKALTQRILDAQGGIVCWNGIYADGPSYILQNDFSCMISPQHFCQFDLPFLQEIADRIPYCMYHLDGPGAVRHIDALLKIEGLKAIQWIPGSGVPGGDYLQSAGILHWIDLFRRIEKGNKSMELYLHLDDTQVIAKEFGPRGLLFKSIGKTSEIAMRSLDLLKG